MNAIVRTIVLILCINLCLVTGALNHDVVYVINLDNCSERLKKMKKQLNRFGIKFQRFRAVNGYDIKIVNMKTGRTEDNRSFHKTCDKNSEYLVGCAQISFKYTPKHCPRILCCGELGCALSHLSIMQDIVKNDYKCAVIFEDDIQFEDNFKNALEKTLDHTPHNADVLFLDVGLCYSNSDPYRANPGTLLECFELLPQDDRYVVKLNGKPSVFGAHAYVLTLNGAKKILQNSQSFAWPIDNHIMMDKRLSQYVARKKMLYITDEISEIHKMGRGFSSLKNSVIVDGEQ